jgi:DNA repair ATPase RecN
VAHLIQKDRVQALRNELSKVQGRREAARSRLKKTQEEVARLQEEELLLSRVGDLFRHLIDKEVVDNAKSAELLLTEGLKTVFDDMNLSARTEVDVQRGKVSVDLYTVQRQANGDTTEAPSVDAYGGSVSVLQSVLLRVVVILRRGMRPLLLLDESLGAVAEQYVPRVGQFLRLLCERVGMDILAVTHNPVLVEAAHKAYRIRKDNGEASFVEIRT